MHDVVHVPALVEEFDDGAEQQLHVHPNTIDNRLSRVDALTGVNPRTAHGLLVLGAAMGVGGAERRGA
ncbi:helix-turn-helix domain-containing protein [Streptomyces fractus]|uniref:helix-turn-helix domain-containing protein n=1 Tax=Streptomyces fractus TaxID=641806 RepID=UPI003CF3ED13